MNRTASSSTFLTIGHSNHQIDVFIALVKQHAITRIVDVRSSPRSQWTPWFNAEPLAARLAENSIGYTPMPELGGRPERNDLFHNGRADYEAMAATDAVKSGIARLISASAHDRLALMCAEKEPLDCHRCLMISRILAQDGFSVQHIHADGHLEDHSALEDRLLIITRESIGLFDDRDQVLSRAYALQSSRAAYRPTANHR